MDPHCYSRRMLNPYHGLVQVVEIPGADAVSRDGLHWTLYIQGEVEYERTDDGRLTTVETPDIKFGNWSPEEGLQRAPVRFVTDYQRLDAIGCTLLEVVKGAQSQLPFPQADRYELWLLDAPAAQPLVLIDTACDDNELAFSASLRWRPGEAAARALGEEITLQLAQLVNGAAGPSPQAQWFVRSGTGHGAGMGGIGLAEALVGRALPPAAFPELLLADGCWSIAAEQALVAAYLEWQAPQLLMLQRLTDATRRRLEEGACRRAASAVAIHHRLYPKVVDEPRVTAALVEARMRQALRREGSAVAEAATHLYPYNNE